METTEFFAFAEDISCQCIPRIQLFASEKIRAAIRLEIEILEINFLLPKAISGACFYALHIHVKINSTLPFFFYLTGWILSRKAMC